MAEQIATEGPAEDKKEALKRKRAGQTCVTLLAVFCITLFSFGQSPLSSIIRNGQGKLRNVRFNMISCLGVAMGVFALIFLLFNVRRVLRLGPTMKVIGLVGAGGLIVHAALALFLPLSFGQGTPPPVGTGGNPVLARSGPEQWVIDGETCAIAGTYYVLAGQGVQYTIEYPHRFGSSLRDMNDQRALAVAFPLMKHAYVNGLHERVAGAKLGEGERKLTRIGVALFERQDGQVRGYGVGLSLGEIKRRIEATSASAPAAPPRATAGSR